MKTSYNNIVILTGAGISAESGIPTFRAADGLWENHKIDDVATPEGFIKNPELVHRFYNERRAYLLDGIEPNKAHLAIAKFMQLHTNKVTLVTQNIDNLHQRAGSKTYPMHGELLKIRCKSSQETFEFKGNSDTAAKCSCCGIAGNLRPHVVWFGEMPLYMDTIEAALNKCELFIAIGTSGLVYPAAGFFQLAKRNGAHTVELNLEASSSGSLFDEQLYGPATDVVPEYLNSLK